MLNPMHITMKKCSNTVYDVVLPARHNPKGEVCASFRTCRALQCGLGAAVEAALHPSSVESLLSKRAKTKAA